MNRTAPSQGPDANAEPDAFDRALAPQFPELLQATRRELRHRLSLNQFAPDDLTPGQLLDMALQHARCERTRLPPDVDIKARALALIFRMAEVLTARNAGRRQKTSELLPEEAEPDPLYEEDEGEFWKSHVLDYPRNEEAFSGAVDRSREDVAGDDELVGLLDLRERHPADARGAWCITSGDCISGWDSADRSPAAPCERPESHARPGQGCALSTTQTRHMSHVMACCAFW
jgi:hypothetical protein